VRRDNYYLKFSLLFLFIIGRLHLSHDSGLTAGVDEGISESQDYDHHIVDWGQFPASPSFVIADCGEKHCRSRGRLMLMRANRLEDLVVLFEVSSDWSSAESGLCHPNVSVGEIFTPGGGICIIYWIRWWRV